MRKIDTVLFDLDGTLLNTLEDLKDSVNEALTFWGYEERTLEEIRRAVGNGIRKLVERSLPGGEDNPDFEQVFDTFKKYYGEHCMMKTELYPGMREVILKLKEQGIAMGIVSNKNQEAITSLWEHYFKEDIPVAIGVTEKLPKKPHPAMVEKALETLGKEKINAVYVGDSEVDEQTGHNAGLPVIQVTWGFRTKEELGTGKVEYQVDTAKELLECLMAL